MNHMQISYLNPAPLSSRYKALESMLEETLKRSVEVREEKIASLESRLNESVSRNKELRKHLMEVRYESANVSSQFSSVCILFLYNRIKTIILIHYYKIDIRVIQLLCLIFVEVHINSVWIKMCT